MRAAGKSTGWVLAGLALLTTGTAHASEADDLDAKVRKWTADLNAGNRPALFAACAPEASVVDGFPPYAWRSCQAWMRDYDANNRRTKATPGTLSIGSPLWVDINGDKAYLSYSATFGNVQDGKPAVYKGMWAISMTRTRQGWKITGSASAWGQ